MPSSSGSVGRLARRRRLLRVPAARLVRSVVSQPSTVVVAAVVVVPPLSPSPPPHAASASDEHGATSTQRRSRVTAASARRTSARASSSLYAVPGSGVAASSVVGRVERATGSAPRRRARAASRRRSARRRRRRAGTTSAAGPSPSGTCSRRRRGTSSSRISSSRLERRRVAVVVRRQPVELGERRARAGRCAPSRRARAARRPGRTDAPTRSSSLAKIACSRCSPSLARQRSPPCSRHGKLEPPVPAARRLEEVAADRAHRAQLRRGREAAGLAQRVRDSRVGLELRQRRAGADRACPSTPRGHDPAQSTSVSAATMPVAQQRDELGAAGERDARRSRARDRLLDATQAAGAPTAPSPVALARLAQRAQHLLARDRQRADVGAGRVADRVRDRGGASG